MQSYFFKRGTVLAGLIGLSLLACNDDDDKHNLRTAIDYSTLTAETPYSEAFVDDQGNPTVDLADGNDRHRMFQALNYYSTSSIAANAHIDASMLSNMFSNIGDPFTDISTNTISVDGDQLNGSEVDLRSVVASSRPDTEAEAIRTTIEGYFEEIEEAEKANAELQSSY